MNHHLAPRPSTVLLTGVLVFSCFLCVGPAVATGQGLDDLFSQENNGLFANADENSEVQPTRVAFQSRPEKRTARFTEETPPSPAGDTAVHSASDLLLVDSPGSRPDTHRPTAMELRQARALAESRARIARLEAARWGLRPTLRPTWVSDPMTASRFQNVQTYFVPVYVRSR